MAKAKRLTVKEENVSCSICLELFIKPRILPCSHSFCHDCLIGYVQKVVVANEFSCPVCRKITFLKTKVDGDIEKRVECFPINRALESIFESHTISELGHICYSCRRENAEAIPKYYCFECNEKLCVECIKYHTKNKFLASHKLCNIENNVYSTTELEYLNKMTKCITHITEDVKYLCKDHDEFCCNECAVVKHRKCNELVSVNRDIMKEDPKKYEKLIKALEENVNALYLHESKQQTLVKESEGKVSQRIVALKRKLEDAFRQLEQTVHDETVQMQQKLLVPIELQLSSIESLRGSLQDLKKKMKTVEDFGQEIHTVLMERKLGEEINNLQAKFRRLYKGASCSEISSAPLGDLMKEVVKALKAENKIKIVKSPKPHIKSPKPRALANSLVLIEWNNENRWRSRTEVSEAVGIVETFEESSAYEQLEEREHNMDKLISVDQQFEKLEDEMDKLISADKQLEKHEYDMDKLISADEQLEELEDDMEKLIPCRMKKTQRKNKRCMNKYDDC